MGPPRTKTSCLLPLVIALAAMALVGCRFSIPPQAPTPDSQSTQVARAVGATLTAVVNPSPTLDLESTRVAVAVEATLAALADDATRTTVPTRTPTPTATPPWPLAEGVVVPGSWLTYTALNDLFTVSYPPSWSVLQERSNLVVLAGPNYVALNIGVVKARCDVSEGAAVEETYPCLALLVAEQEGGAYELQLVSIGKWSDGTHRGFALEYTEYNPEYDAYTYNVHVYLPLDDQTMVVALYLHVGTETLTDQEREDLATMIGSIRLPER